MILDLARLFQDSKADIDVISHSRGGLVAAFRRPSPTGRARPCAAAVVSAMPAMTSQMADALPNRSTTQPPTRLAAMKLSEPQTRMWP